ncbi:HD domain-containing protein [Acholeplasma granularum]|uniref:HD domain-containing protein n=1 Tax=Acholeplasma granularum TaxID=264635 RepID=UPI0004B13B70|nr:HD domain-containing protein [Acholeplasma granularum]
MDFVIGKVESINKGDNYCNASLSLEDKKHFNVKLGMKDDQLLTIGKIFIFEVEPFYREDVIQYKATKITPLETSDLPQKDKNKYYSNFYNYAPLPLNEIREGIESYLNKISNKILFEVTSDVYNKYEGNFYLHPAATKFHHAYVGGLAYHTFTMLKMVDAMLSVYSYLNPDLLYAGTILHDISKIEEMTGVDGEYTKEGQLLGHLVMASLEVEKSALKLGYENTEEVLLLKHLIVSHHGLLNFGSPKKPQTGEALLLWYIDSIDSKFTELKDALDSTKPGEFTNSLAVLDKMRFYKPKL